MSMFHTETRDSYPISPRKSGNCPYFFYFLLLLVGLGCASRPMTPAATQTATDINLATTQPSYWLDQPANATARGDDFERLFAASEDTARDFLFRIDRVDYRAGLLTTWPLVSKQWFEFWRPDVQTWDDLEESSLATIRRTIRFQINCLDDGTFEVTPMVLVERQTLVGARITSAVQYRRVFAPEIDPRYRARGTREADVGVRLPNRYWTPIGRDPALEKALAKSIEKKVTKAPKDSEPSAPAAGSG